MWVRPIPAGIYLWGFWSVVKENEYYYMYQGNASLPFPYHIVLKEGNLLLAQGADADAIEVKWQALEKDRLNCVKRGFETTETVDFFKNKILTLAETQEKKLQEGKLKSPNATDKSKRASLTLTGSPHSSPHNSFGGASSLSASPQTASPLVPSRDSANTLRAPDQQFTSSNNSNSLPSSTSGGGSGRTSLDLSSSGSDKERDGLAGQRSASGANLTRRPSMTSITTKRDFSALSSNKTLSKRRSQPEQGRVSDGENALSPEWVPEVNKAGKDLLARYGLKETLISTYSVTMWKKPLPYQGTMAVCQNYIAFGTSMEAKALILPFTTITKLRQVGLNSFRIETQIESEFEFLCWGSSGELLSMLTQLWKRALGNLERSASYVKKETEKRRYADVKRGRRSSQEEDDSEAREQPDEHVDEGAQTKEDFEIISKKERFCRLFNMPSAEIFVSEFPLSGLEYIAFPSRETGQGRVVAKYSGGTVYFTTNFMCIQTFGGPENAPKYSGETTYVIPLLEIKKCDRIKSLTKEQFTTLGAAMEAVGLKEQLKGLGKRLIPAVVTILTYTATFVLSIANRTRFYTLLLALHEPLKTQAEQQALPAINKELNKLKDGEGNRFEEAVLQDRDQFTQAFHEQQRLLKRDYKEYFDNFGGHLCMSRTKYLTKLIRLGVPMELKSKIWQFASCSYAYKIFYGPTYYQKRWKKQERLFATMDRTAENKSEMQLILEQIERDLHRSLPGQNYYGRKEIETDGIKALRRVLHGFADHNPVTGYCQAMNIIVATLLLFLPEEDTFYLLISIIEKIPDYYEKNMIGSIVDLSLFGELLKQRLPHLHQHFQNIYADLTLIVLPWFLTLFIGYVPWEVSLRVLDCFFAEGPNVLPQVGLALMKINEKELLEMEDVVSTVALIKNTKIDVEQLIRVAFVEFELDYATVNQMRNSHKYLAIQNIQQANKNNIIYDLKRNTRFTTEELEVLFGHWERSINVDSRNNCIDCLQFSDLLAHHCNWLEGVVTQMEFYKLFIYFNQGREMMSFSEYVRGLDVMLKGSSDEHQKTVFNTYMGTNSLLSRDYFVAAVTLLLTFEVYAKGTDIVHPHEYVLVNMEEIATFDQETMDRFWHEALKKPTAQAAIEPAAHKAANESENTNTATTTTTTNGNSTASSSSSSQTPEPSTTIVASDELLVRTGSGKTLNKLASTPLRTTGSKTNTNSGNYDSVLNPSLLSHHAHTQQHEVLGINLEQFIYACLLIESAKEIEDSSADYSRDQHSSDSGSGSMKDSLKFNTLSRNRNSFTRTS